MADDSSDSRSGGFGSALLKGGLSALAASLGSGNQPGGSQTWGQHKVEVDKTMQYQKPLAEIAASEIGKETRIREPQIDAHPFTAARIDTRDTIKSIDHIHADIA